MAPFVPVPLLEHEPAVPEAAPEALLRVLQSRTFQKAPGLRKLLIYLWEHAAENIAEYAIAVEALGRKPDFDAKIDATVRVQVSRLRRRLKDFYDTEGAELTARVDIPLGTHQVHIVEIAPVAAKTSVDVSAAEVSNAETIQTTARRSRLVPALCVVIACLATLCAWLILEPRMHRVPSTPKEQAALPSLWQGFLNNGKAARIVIPNPVFFSWGTGFKVRDANVNDFSHLKDSARLADMEQRLGTPVLAQDYTVASDTFASLRLARYFDAHGLRPQVSSSAESSPETLEHENLIVLGTQGTLSPFQPYLDRLSFRFAPHKSYIDDIHPLPGQPKRFESIRASGARTISPGIIALLPSGNSDSRIFLIVGYHTTALVSYVTSPAGVNELAKAQAAHGNATFFEAVVVSEVNDTTALRTSLASFKKYTAN